MLTWHCHLRQQISKVVAILSSDLFNCHGQLLHLQSRGIRRVDGGDICQEETLKPVDGQSEHDCSLPTRHFPHPATFSALQHPVGLRREVGSGCLIEVLRLTLEHWFDGGEVQTVRTQKTVIAEHDTVAAAGLRVAGKGEVCGDFCLLAEQREGLLAGEGHFLLLPG